jgi:hypothetical protein
MYGRKGRNDEQRKKTLKKEWIKKERKVKWKKKERKKKKEGRNVSSKRLSWRKDRKCFQQR